MSKFKKIFSDKFDHETAATSAADEESLPKKGKRWKPDDAKVRMDSYQRQFEASSTSSSSSTSVPVRTFKEVVGNLFLTNKLSALHVHSLAASESSEGAQCSKDFAKAGAGGKHPQNFHRDILRGLLKDAKWPREYYAEIPIKNDKGEMELVLFPFLLPHEVFRHLLKANGLRMRDFLCQENTELAELVKEFCAKFQVDPLEILAIGLHGDGAPFAAKMRDSLEQLSWSFVSDPGSSRIVFTAVPKSGVGDGTFNAIFEVFAWSMRCLLLGVMPSVRRDGTPFVSSDDSERKTWAGETLLMKAALLQVRGDWAFYKSTFNFAGWSSELICWLCSATKSRGSRFDYRQCGKEANWKFSRYALGDFEAMLREKGQLSTIFRTPGLLVKHFLIDWLHAVDLGVSQSIIGNVLWEILDLYPGANRGDKLKMLWEELKNYYREYKPPSKLDGLTIEMLKLPGKGPKLRSKAAECRYLLPFAALMAEKYNDGSPHRSTVMHVIKNLLEVSLCLSESPYDSNRATMACRRCCLLYVQLAEAALSTGDSLSWRVKPKLHMFQELIEFVSPEFGNPRHFWTYKDESWGGFLSAMATRRGGPKFAATTALNLLRRYRCCVTDEL